jgi:hypothetical protein
VRVGNRGSRAVRITVKAMDAVKNLNRSRQGPSGVGGVERSDSGDGNWGGPPRPGDLRVVIGKASPITGSTGKWMSCRVGVGGGRSTAGAGRKT